MKVPRIQFCCFCISLRTAGLLLGYLGAIFNFIVIINSIKSLVAFDDEIDSFHQLALASLQSDKLAKNLVEFHSVHRALEIISIVIGLLAFISSVTLLMGVYKKSPKWVKQWNFVMIVCLILTYIHHGLVVYSSVEEARVLIGIFLILGDLIGLGKKLKIFFIL